MNIFLEIRLEHYYKAIKMFIFIVNIIIGYIAFFIYIFKKIDVETLLKYRKVFLLLHILIATLLTPPDINSQTYVFLSLTALLESRLFVSIFLLKSRKYIFKGIPSV